MRGVCRQLGLEAAGTGGAERLEDVLSAVGRSTGWQLSPSNLASAIVEHGRRRWGLQEAHDAQMLAIVARLVQAHWNGQHEEVAGTLGTTLQYLEMVACTAPRGAGREDAVKEAFRFMNLPPVVMSDYKTLTKPELKESLESGLLPREIKTDMVKDVSAGDRYWSRYHKK